MGCARCGSACSMCCAGCSSATLCARCGTGCAVDVRRITGSAGISATGSRSARTAVAAGCAIGSAGRMNMVGLLQRRIRFCAPRNLHNLSFFSILVEPQQDSDRRYGVQLFACLLLILFHFVFYFCFCILQPAFNCVFTAAKLFGYRF